MLATACMWWAMLCYQLVALAQLVASHLPFLLSLVEMWRLAAAQLLPLGQASMAVYGLSVGVTGVREATELAEEMRLVRTSSALATFPLLKAVLGCQLSWLFAANMAAEVVAGPMLCVGQALMALGAPGMWGSVYALMMGGILSGISIAAKTAVDLDTASRFGYDEDALPVPHILVSHLPSQMPRCQHHLDLSSLAVIQRRRERRLRKLAWLKAIGTLVPAVASRALREEGERGPGGGRGNEWVRDAACHVRLELAQGMYPRGYDRELNDYLKQLVNDTQAWHTIAEAAALYSGVTQEGVTGEDEAWGGAGGGGAGRDEIAEEENLMICKEKREGQQDLEGGGGVGGDRDGGRGEGELGRWRPWLQHVRARRSGDRVARRRQPLFLAFLYLKGVDENLDKLPAAVVHDKDECIAGEEEDDLWVVSTAQAVAAASRAWVLLSPSQRLRQVLSCLEDTHQHQDAVHLAVLEELLIWQRLRPRGHGSPFSRGVDLSASSECSASQARATRQSLRKPGGLSGQRAGGSQVVGSLIERTPCVQKRRIKIPGGTLWRYMKGKHAYRFQVELFLQQLRARELAGPPPPPTPPPPPPPGSSPSVCRAEGATRAAEDLERWREEERVWWETEVALGWVETAVEEACWAVVKLDAKSSLRSEIACLNEVCLLCAMHAVQRVCV